jgi:5-methylcytosine-specific restriction endonuclease McrA
MEAAMANDEFSTEIISRIEAKRRGLKYFFTGKPCKHGHVYARYSSTGICVECGYARWKSRRSVVVRVAVAAGKKRYVTGLPCPNGHIAERYVSSRLCVICCAERKKQWACDNPDKVRAYDKKRNEENPEQARIWARNWRKSNPDLLRNRKRQDYARRKNAPGKYSLKDIEEIFAAQRGKCAYCRKKLKSNYHVDHITSIAKGGTNYRRNLQILCRSCNSAKRDLDPIEHMQQRGMLL